MTARDGVKISERFPWGRCEGCGKFAFESRRAAKRYMQSRFKGSGMTVYKCPLAPYYHFGHTPTAVKEGTKVRGVEATRRKEWMQPLSDPSNEG